jgi:CheY-like chemotaxis protein
VAELVNDVLDLSQIEAGRMALSKEWTSAGEIVDEAVLALQAFFDSKGLYLRTEIPTDLPPLYCDSTRVSQVVTNLLSNAGRFTERGGVQIRAWREQDEVVISVTDTGPGIPAKDQGRLFEPFQQLDGSVRRRHGGSGLGLSISKRFIEMHEGRMWLESQVGAGTTFYFGLPLETPLGAILDDGVARWFSPYHQYAERTHRSKAPPPQPVPRYVLLEAGDTLRSLLNRYLGDAEIDAVHSVERALSELSRSPAQALIVNAPSAATGLAGEDGWAALPYDTPVVTCWVPGEDDAAKQLGVVRYLVKPVTHQELLTVLRDLGQGIESVLLVDDEPDILQLFVRMLSSAEPGYRVWQAKTGRRALSLLRRRRPDVVLLDLIMPDVDGFQVLEEKSRDPAIRDIPVVVISSRDPTNAPIASNMVAVTRKGGLSVAELLACIRAMGEILSPSAQSDGPVRPERPAG